MPDSIYLFTPNLATLSVELSYKIFDPVESPEEDGQIFSSELRKNYLNRAYNKFIRVAEITHPDILKVLPGYYNIIDISSCISGEQEIPEGYYIEQLYYQISSKSKLQKLRPIDPEEYLATKASIDAFFSPQNTERFWCRLNNKIQLLPSDPTLYSTLLSLATRKVITLRPDQDIDLSSSYFDLLLVLACMEAMADKGDWNVYKAQSDIFYTDIKLLMDYKTKIERKDDN